MSKLYFFYTCNEHHYTTDVCPNTPTIQKRTKSLALVALLGLTACGEESKDTAEDTAVTEDTGMISDSGMADLYGVPDTASWDNDGDGYTPEDGDCDDNNPEVNPGADETPGDGVDSNCDGEDDT